MEKNHVICEKRALHYFVFFVLFYCIVKDFQYNFESKWHRLTSLSHSCSYGKSGQYLIPLGIMSVISVLYIAFIKLKMFSSVFIC